ncbi:MAG: glycosyltransferase family 4 protein [Terrimicrobiaceae bacterium]
MFRLAHFIHSDVAGGGPKVVRQLLEGLDAGEFEQSLVHGGNGWLSKWCREKGIEEIMVPTVSVVSGVLGLGALVSAFRRLRPDVVVLHGQWAAPLGAWAARRAGVPHAIYIAHCPAFYHSTTLFRAIRNYIAEKIPCSLCDRVVTLSDGNYYNYLYRGWAPEKHLVEIHNGVDPDDVPSAEGVDRLKENFQWRNGTKNAVFVGRVDDQKRVDWLLEAWQSAIRSGPGSQPKSWHLWIVGDGEERGFVERHATGLALGDSVHFVGSQPDGMAWIAAADLLVLSSLYEGHALVPLEAMACGKPVVAFATDGVSDSVADGETGLLAQLGDTQALGNSIARLLANPEESRRMGIAGRERVAARFPIAKTMARYADLVRGLARSTKPPKP